MQTSGKRRLIVKRNRVEIIQLANWRETPSDQCSGNVAHTLLSITQIVKPNKVAASEAGQREIFRLVDAALRIHTLRGVNGAISAIYIYFNRHLIWDNYCGAQRHTAAHSQHIQAGTRSPHKSNKNRTQFMTKFVYFDDRKNSIVFLSVWQSIRDMAFTTRTRTVRDIFIDLFWQ